VDVAIAQPDFIKLADAYGIKGIRVTERSEVAMAIAEARAHPGPVLMDIHVDQEENVWPMVPAGASLAETIEIPEEEMVR
jgi:acetolactate synthase-1/2/3 large subunit